MKLNKFRILAVTMVATLALALAGCADDDDDDDNVNPPQAGEQQSPQQRRAVELKNEIRQIVIQADERLDARDNTSRMMTKLDPLVRELESMDEERDASELQTILNGSWRQVYSNNNMGSHGKDVLANSVYQIILDNGRMWHLALTERGESRGSILIGANYALEGDTMTFTYNKFLVTTDWMDIGAGLNELGTQAQDGAFDNSVPEDDARSPVGEKGTMEHVYVDQDFRIARSGQEFFILERAETLEDPDRELTGGTEEGAGEDAGDDNDTTDPDTPEDPGPVPGRGGRGGSGPTIPPVTNNP